MSKLLKELIKQSNLIEGIDDPKEIKQSMYAWDYLIEQPDLSHSVICKVQKVITLHQAELMPHHRGYYRDMAQINVQVGRYTPPTYAEVPALMEHWVAEYSQMTPWEAHVEFERIHPFVDGNGRTGRMLMWWDEIRRGGEPTMIEATKRWDYYTALNDGRGKL